MSPKRAFCQFFFFFFKAIGRAVYIYCSLSLSLSMETIEKEADKKGKKTFFKNRLKREERVCASACIAGKRNNSVQYNGGFVFFFFFPIQLLSLELFSPQLTFDLVLRDYACVIANGKALSPLPFIFSCYNIRILPDIQVLFSPSSSASEMHS